MRSIRRRRCLQHVRSAVGAVVFGLLLLCAAGSAQNRSAPVDTLRVGVVVPTQTEGRALHASLYDIVGEASQEAATLAERDAAEWPGVAGTMSVQVLLASTPSAAAARRAASRLVNVEQVHALVGGLGAGQAEAIAEVAVTAGIPFINVGDSGERFRQRFADEHVFHIEASAAMYADALVGWFSTMGHERWYIVYENSEEGLLRKALVEAAVVQRDAGAIVGSVAVEPGQHSYFAELQRLHGESPDVMALMLDPQDQLVFIAQQESVSPDVAVAAYPHQVTQTRDYLGAAQAYATTVESGRRILSWEATLHEGEAQELNESFASRMGRPMDPAAWQTYAAIKILAQSTATIGSTNGDDLAEYLLSSETSFEVGKSAPVRFHRQHGQLLHELYAVEIDQEVVWRYALEEQLAIVRFVGRLPWLYDADASLEQMLGRHR